MVNIINPFNMRARAYFTGVAEAFNQMGQMPGGGAVGGRGGAVGGRAAAAA
jgi:hypothetical protein